MTTPKTVREQVEEAVGRYDKATDDMRRLAFGGPGDSLNEAMESRELANRLCAARFQEHATLFAAAEEVAAELAVVKADNERLREAIKAVIHFEHSFRCEENTVDFRNRAYTALENLRAALNPGASE